MFVIKQLMHIYIYNKFLLYSGIICFIIIYTASGIYATTMSSIVLQGAQQSVSTQIVAMRHPYVVSIADDSSVQVLNIVTGLIESRVMTFTENTVMALALHPRVSEFAIVHMISVGKYQISVWNWEQGTQLYTHIVHSPVLFLRYSTTGRYVAYSETSKQGIYLFDTVARSSAPHSIAISQFVSDVYFNSSDKIVLLYAVVVGKIFYYNITEKKIVYEVQTRANLHNIHVLPKRSQLALGYTDSGFHVVDTLKNNRIHSTYKISGIQSLFVTDDELVIVKSYKNLQIFTVDKDLQIQLLVTQAHTTYGNSEVKYTFMNNQLFTVYDNGEITAQLLQTYKQKYVLSKPQKIIQSQTIPIKKLVLVQNTLFIQNIKGMVYSVDIAQFQWNKKSELLLHNVDIMMHSDLQDMDLITAYNEHLFLYDTQKQHLFFAGDSKSYVSLHRNDVIAMCDDDTFGIIHKQKRARVYSFAAYAKNTDTWLKPIFDYTDMQLLSLVNMGKYGIFLGKSSAGIFKTPLLSVARSSYETQALFIEDSMIYAMAGNETHQVLYTVGMHNDANQLYTTVRMLSDTNFKKQTVIMQVPYSLLDVPMFIDDKTGFLFLYMNTQSIVQWDTQKLHAFAIAPVKPIQLYVYGRALVSINTDGSIGLWDKKTRRFVAQIYQVNENTWAAIDGVAQQPIVLQGKKNALHTIFPHAQHIRHAATTTIVPYSGVS